MGVARKDTVEPERRLLAVTHNVTAATRLLDLLRVLDGDRRVGTYFTTPGSSAFPEGLDAYFAERGIRCVPWDEAVTLEFDAALSTSRGGELHLVRAPLVYAPHGAGYNKVLATVERPSRSINQQPNGAFGLTPEWLVRDGLVVPSAIAVSHEEQLRRLADGCPEAVPSAFVCGDPCADQLDAARPFRAAYREAFGIPQDVALVVASSTWGPGSLVGSGVGIIDRALAELPLDEYRVLLAVHPNTWLRHSPWQVRTWLAPLLDAGLVLPRPETEDWKAALVAADFVIGDHGSLTAYAAGTRLPTILGAFDHSSVAPGSPMDALGRCLPRLSTERDVATQLHAAAADRPRLIDAARTACLTSAPGAAAARMRSALYELLKLDEPPHPATIPIPPLPRSHRDQAADQRPYAPASWVRAEPAAEPVRTHVTRLPFHVPRWEPPRESVLFARLGDPTAADSAEVLIGDRHTNPAQVPALLRRHVGCRILALPCGDHAWDVWSRAPGDAFRRFRISADASAAETPVLAPELVIGAAVPWLDSPDADLPSAIQVLAGPRRVAVLRLAAQHP